MSECFCLSLGIDGFVNAVSCQSAIGRDIVASKKEVAEETMLNMNMI